MRNGMLGLETSLEEFMTRVVGHLIQNGSAVKIADDFLWGI